MATDDWEMVVAPPKRERSTELWDSTAAELEKMRAYVASLLPAARCSFNEYELVPLVCHIRSFTYSLVHPSEDQTRCFAEFLSHKGSRAFIQILRGSKGTIRVWLTLEP